MVIRKIIHAPDERNIIICGYCSKDSSYLRNSLQPKDETMSSTDEPYISMMEQAGQPEKETRAKETMTDTKASDVDVAKLFKPAESTDAKQPSS